MAQQEDFRAACVRRRADAVRTQAVQVAAGLLDLGEDVAAGPAGGGGLGHDGETRQPETPAQEAGLPQSPAGLERDHQHVPAFGPDGLQHRPGQHRRGVDAGQRDRVPRDRPEPRGEDPGAGDRAEQHAVVTPAARRPAEARRMDVARVGKQPGRLRAQQRAAVPPEHVGNRRLAKLLLHHAGDDVRDLVRTAFEVAREPREPRLVRAEREGFEQLPPFPVVHGQPGVRDEEDAPRGHQIPISAMRS